MCETFSAPMTYKKFLLESCGVDLWLLVDIETTLKMVSYVREHKQSINQSIV